MLIPKTKYDFVTSSWQEKNMYTEDVSEGVFTQPPPAHGYAAARENRVWRLYLEQPSAIRSEAPTIRSGCVSFFHGLSFGIKFEHHRCRATRPATFGRNNSNTGQPTRERTVIFSFMYIFFFSQINLTSRNSFEDFSIALYAYRETIFEISDGPPVSIISATTRLAAGLVKSCRNTHRKRVIPMYLLKYCNYWNSFIENIHTARTVMVGRG